MLITGVARVENEKGLFFPMQREGVELLVSEWTEFTMVNCSRFQTQGFAKVMVCSAIKS